MSTPQKAHPRSSRTRTEVFSWRFVLTRLHRWFGLSAGVFLFMAGLTGAIIAWDHELDGWLNPALFHAPGTGPVQSAGNLARLIEQQDPAVRVRFMPLAPQAGEAFIAFVEPRDPQAAPPGYNQVFLDPVTGQRLGAREWGAFALDRLHLIPFLYALHYSLHLPNVGSSNIGILLMGGIAIVWVLDCFIALWISFPSLKAWRKSLSFRWQAGGMRLVFDLHRSGGVWIWLLLLLIALTSVSMNLEYPVVRPLLSIFSAPSASAFNLPGRQAKSCAAQACLSWEQMTTSAQAEARAHKIDAPAGGIFLGADQAIYGVGFYAAGQDHGNGGLGNPWLYFDAHSGQLLSASIPGQGTAGDLYLQAQFPIHSGRILGLGGRILVSLLGLAVATLSATGILLWVRKRRSARLIAQQKRNAPLPRRQTSSL